MDVIIGMLIGTGIGFFANRAYYRRLYVLQDRALERRLEEDGMRNKEEMKAFLRRDGGKIW